MKVTKRDTIIIAVLLNISLLALLFAFANRQEDKRIAEKKESPKEAIAAKNEKVVVAEPPQQEQSEISKEPVDEIDQVLQEYALQQKGTPEKVDSSDHTLVTVKRGDSLSKIAKEHNVSQSALMQINNLKSGKLKEGQQLKIPATESKVVETAADADAEVGNATPKEKSQGAKYYTIKSGDNPWKIAKRFHLKDEELLRLNNLDAEKAKNLKVGQKIRIR